MMTSGICTILSYKLHIISLTFSHNPYGYSLDIAIHHPILSPALFSSQPSCSNSFITLLPQVFWSTPLNFSPHFCKIIHLL